MKIGIDIQTTLGQKTGFGFYVDNLVKAMQKIRGDNELAFFYPDSEHDLSTPQRWWWDQISLPKAAYKAKVDLLHQPAFSVPIWYPGKKIVTIHDTISLFYTDIPFVSRQYYAKWMPFSYNYGDHFITISNHSKKDIMERMHIPADKITVTYEAADERFRLPVSADKKHEVCAKYGIKPPFLLDVGTLNPRKNLEFLIKAFAKSIKHLDKPYQLVLTGKKGWHYDQLFKLVEDLGLNDRVIFTGYVDDDDKPALYHASTMFVFPSVYEGFGLPPLEAMTCGVPVISSNTSSLPEVVGDGGISLDPHDEAEWVKSIIEVLSHEKLHHDLSERAAKQAAKFSWDRCAKETLAVYEMFKK
ncbi:MAG: glycosyltransferase family 1 protein [Patescibacteria group bacterium]|jgi:glycosyltransferase involved in cell wall biosynthesis